MELEERRTLLRMRRYCRKVNSLTGKECGGFIGKSRGGHPNEPPKTLCRECWAEACRICGAPLFNDPNGSSSLLDHTCIFVPPQREAEVVPIDDAKQGVHYQICPNSQCGQVFYLAEGCNAVTCRQSLCRTQFCIKCGQKALHNSDHWKPRPGGCPRWTNMETGGGQFDPPEQGNDTNEPQHEFFDPFPAPFDRSEGPRFQVFPGVDCNHEEVKDDRCVKCDRDMSNKCLHEMRYWGVCCACDVVFDEETGQGSRRVEIDCGWLAEQLADYCRRNFIGVYSQIREHEVTAARLVFEVFFTDVSPRYVAKVRCLETIGDTSATKFTSEIATVIAENHDWFTLFLDHIFLEAGYVDWGPFILGSPQPSISGRLDVTRSLPDSSVAECDYSLELTWLGLAASLDSFFRSKSQGLGSWLNDIETRLEYDASGERPDYAPVSDIHIEIGFSAAMPGFNKVSRATFGHFKCLNTPKAKALYVVFCNRILPLAEYKSKLFRRLVEEERDNHPSMWTDEPRPFFDQDFVIERICTLTCSGYQRGRYELAVPMSILRVSCGMMEDLHSEEVEVRQKFDNQPLLQNVDWSGDAVHIVLNFGADEMIKHGPGRNGLVTAIKEAWYTSSYHRPPSDSRLQPVKAYYNLQLEELSMDVNNEALTWTPSPWNACSPVTIRISEIEGQSTEGDNTGGIVLALIVNGSSIPFTFDHEAKRDAVDAYINLRCLQLQRLAYLNANGMGENRDLSHERAWLEDFLCDPNVSISGDKCKFWTWIVTNLREHIMKERLQFLPRLSAPMLHAAVARADAMDVDG